MSSDADLRTSSDLPPGWVWTTLGQAAQLNPRDPALRDLPDHLPVSFLPMAAVDAEQGCIVAPVVRPLSEVRKGFTAFANGDVLFAKITPCMENGKAAIARDLKNGLGFGSTEFHVLRPEAGALADWLFHFVRQENFRKDAKARFAGTAGQLRVPSAFLDSYPIPLPPLPEQRRIVAEIEQQFTRLDAGVAALKRVQANLKRYRASVLKAACEGRLAPQGPANEPADRLLARILAERRAKWEAEHPGKKYVEPAAPETDGLPSLPEGWCWTSVEQACDRIVDCLHSTPIFTIAGRLCVDSNCIEPGRIVLERARYVDESTFEERNRRMIPQEDDVVFSREGALLGIAVRTPANLSFCLGQRMMIFRPSAAMLGRFFEDIVNSLVFRSQYRGLITGTASPHLNIGDIRPLAIPLSPLPEQHRIVAEVERRLSVVAELAAAVAANLARAGRLRQAVLKRAFEGRLVAQESNEQLASACMEKTSTICSGLQAESNTSVVDGK